MQEIGGYAWYNLDHLPDDQHTNRLEYKSGEGSRHRFFMVRPFSVVTTELSLVTVRGASLFGGYLIPRLGRRCTCLALRLLRVELSRMSQCSCDISST